jgi:toxin ParE1/3/4
MRTVRFSKRARRHLLSVARYLFEESGDRRAGDRFVREIEERMLKVGAIPTILGTPRVDLGTNLHSVSHKAYLIFFRYESDRIDVLHVMHSQRDLRGYFTGVDED